MSHSKTHSHNAPGAHPPPAQLSTKALAGLSGIFIAAMMAGLNNRVGALGLADIRGALGYGLDDASWITTAYTVGELIATPFATWFAITLSVRRFHWLMVSLCALIATCLPFVQNLQLLIALRFIQGMSSGALIPILMMAALKFLPPSIRLHGLALYAMTATFTPNIAVWLVGQWTDGLAQWRWIYWQIIPISLVATVLTGWGLPKEKITTVRFKEGNWFGMLLGASGLALIAIALDQGVRLDWFQSPLISVALLSGIGLLALYLLTEWFHHAPFLKLQLLARRNLWLGSGIFAALLVTLSSGVLLPSTYLAAVQQYRPMQMAPLVLWIALPQLVLGSGVAIVLYQKWADARHTFCLGLVLIAVACLLGAQLTAEWHKDQFFVMQALQAVGQPLAIISQLFLMTSVVQPTEGPYFSGTINTVRVLGSLIGNSLIGHILAQRTRFHTEMLLEHSSQSSNMLDTSQLGITVTQQALVLSVADAYQILGVMALMLIPLVLYMTYIPAPTLNKEAQPSPASSSSHG